MVTITHNETRIQIGEKVFEFSAIPIDYEQFESDEHTLPPSVHEDIDVLIGEVLRLQTENDVLKKLLMEK